MRPEYGMGRGARVLQIAALGLILSGCAALWAPKADYADYRRVRLAASQAEAAMARARYLRHHPHGVWAERVRRVHREGEASLFLAGRDDPETLKAYLRAYPEGRFAAQAQARLAALRTLARQRAEERDRIEAKRRRMLRMRRQWARRAVRFWTRTLLNLEGWGGVLPEVARANPAFDEAFGRAPRPRCVVNECVKFYRLDFLVPVPGGTGIRRRLDLALRLRVRAGRLIGADLLFPGRGFSRWFELERREPVDDLDEARRAEALSWVSSVFEPMVRAAWPEARPVDWVPEPVPALTIPLPSRVEEGASVLPDEVSEPRQGDARPALPLPPRVEASETEPALTLPVALGAWQRGPLTLVLFAAPPEPASSSGPAYDGVSILWQASSKESSAEPVSEGSAR